MSSSSGSAILAVHLTPRAAADRVGPLVAGELQVRVTRPPTDGEANRALLRVVAEALGVPPSAVRIVSGERGRRKRLEIEGVTAVDLSQRLARLH